MTDITDHTAGIRGAWERGVAGPLAEFLTTFARGIAARPDVYSDDLVNSARAVLDNVDAPTTTLAEDLRHIAEHWEEWQTATITSAIRAAADRAEQTEEALAVEGRRVEKIAAERDEAKKERDHFFREVENVRNWKEQLLDERDEAWTEVERLNREQDRLCAQVQGLVRRDGDHNSEVRMLTEERDEARAEVERLTAVNKSLPMPPGDIPGTALPINISAIVPDPTTPDPADVKPGEAWIVEVNGKRGTALKDGGGLAPWSVVINGVFTSRCDEFIALVARLVPEPRTVRYESKEK